MKILFVSSGNLQLKKNPIILNQAASLKKYQNIEVEHYFIKGKGIWGYLRNIPYLKKYIKKVQPDIVHAHYSFSGIIAALSTKRPVVTSLMGSDINRTPLFTHIIKFFSKYCWKRTIVKSNQMKKKLSFKDLIVLPNGVDLKNFYPIDKVEAKQFLNLNVKRRYILFVSVFNENNYAKNYPLAERIFYKVKAHNNYKDTEMLSLHNIPNKEMKYYYSAADLLLLTSRWEGSPNTVKEAMACNCPIVSTNVGDVKDVVKGTNLCFVSEEGDPEIMKKNILEIFKSNSRSNGRDNIDKISSEVISNHLRKIYYNAQRE